MLTIYGRTNSVNVQKVLWCLAELALPYVRVDAGLEHGKNSEAWYLALNPNGKVPLLTDGSFALWESNTIVRYLSGKHGLGSLCPASLEVRALAERWMDWQLSTLVLPVSVVFQNLIRRSAAERDVAAIERNTPGSKPRHDAARRAPLAPAIRRRRGVHDGRHPRRSDGAPLARDSRHRPAATGSRPRMARAASRAAAFRTHVQLPLS